MSPSGAMRITRRHLLAAVGVFSGGAVAGALAHQLAGPTGPAQPVVRVGTVVASPAATAEIVWVEVVAGEPPLDLPYLSGYVPVPGDQVQVLFLSAGSSMQGLVIGGRAGQSANIIPNGDFGVVDHLRPASTAQPPYTWSKYVASGPEPAVGGVLNTVRQRQMMLLDALSSASSDTRVYSAAIPVAPGQVLELDAMYDAYLGTNTSLTIELRVGWFSTVDAVYPNFSSESLVDSDVIAADTNFWQSGSVTAPAGATHARVAVRVNYTNSGAGATYQFFVAQVTARRA